MCFLAGSLQASVHSRLYLVTSDVGHIRFRWFYAGTEDLGPPGWGSCHFFKLPQSFIRDWLTNNELLRGQLAVPIDFVWFFLLLFSSLSLPLSLSLSLPLSLSFFRNSLGPSISYYSEVLVQKFGWKNTLSLSLLSSSFSLLVGSLCIL